MKIDYAESKDQIKNNLLGDKLYDFIIIGSGPAAITLYKKILSKKKKAKILILEAGNFYKKILKEL